MWQVRRLGRWSVAVVFVVLTGCSYYTSKWGRPAYHTGLSDESPGGTWYIDGADRWTFHVFRGTGYAKDKNRVYYQGRVLKGADAASFQPLGRDYGRDASHGFCRMKTIPGADGPSLTLLPGGDYVRDKRDVYQCTVALHPCDPKTFHGFPDHSDWSADDQCAYLNDAELVGADGRTFRVINSWYARDADHVYSNITGLMPGTNPANFHLIEHPCDLCASDGKHCYNAGTVVSCDPAQAAIDERKRKRPPVAQRQRSKAEQARRFKPLAHVLNDNARLQSMRDSYRAVHDPWIDGAAYDRYHALAESGDAVGEYQMGKANLYNLIAPSRTDAALTWLERAAAQHEADAQVLLGEMYENDMVPTDADYATAAQWYGKAAVHGIARAQTDLGNLYLNGHGLPKDAAQAATWYRKAARQGYARAQADLGALYLTGQGVPRDDARALHLFHRAAAKGYPPAQSALGLMYASGFGVKQDDSRAVLWYRKALAKEDPLAIYNLAFMYVQGRGVSRSDIIADALFFVLSDFPQLGTEFGERCSDARLVLERRMTLAQTEAGWSLYLRMKNEGIMDVLREQAAGGH